MLFKLLCQVCSCPTDDSKLQASLIQELEKNSPSCGRSYKIGMDTKLQMIFINMKQGKNLWPLLPSATRMCLV